MALEPAVDISSSEKIFREIQTEHKIYQINSSSDAKKIADKMKKDTNEIAKAMETARRTAYERKIATDELKISLSEKKDKMKTLQQDLQKIRKNVEKATKRNSDFHVETIKIEAAIEKIKEASQDLDPKYLEKTQRELMDTLVKVTLESEKAQSELNAAEKMEAITNRKLQEFENECNRLENHTMDKIHETEMTISNVASTIEHIMKTYDQVTAVSKDLLKMATSTKTKFSEQESQEIHQDAEPQQQKIEGTPI